MYQDRVELSRGLRAALAASDPLSHLSTLLRQVLTSASVAWDSEDQRVIRLIVERLDAINSTSGSTSDRLVTVAGDWCSLLDLASSNDQVELLMELLADRHRASDMIRKLLTGIIPQGAFLSFVSSQRWPRTIRQTTSALTSTQLERLARALEQNDVIDLQSIFDVQPE